MLGIRESRRVIAVSAAVFGLWAPSAHALTIVPTYATGFSSQAQAAFNAVVADFDKSFTSPITVNITVSWGSVAGQSLPSNAVGASSTNLYGYYSYSQILSALIRNANNNPSNTALAMALKSLPSTAPAGVSRYVVASAEAKALGLISANQAGADGYIGFAGAPSGYTFTTTGAVTAGTYDFSAVAAHEIEEVLGRISGISGAGTPPYRTVFDLYRYSAPGVLNDNYTGLAYFSVDGGKTNLSTFNNSASGGDRSDWQTTGTSSDIQDAFISKGQRKNLTAVDLAALDVLGYGGPNLGNSSLGKPNAVAFNLGGSVPEPATWMTLLLGLGLAGAGLRRRTVRVQ